MTPERRETAKRVTRGLVSAAMVTVGVLHFVRADTFAQIVPPFLPAPLWLVWISGVLEILGGVGILIPRTRAAAGIGLILLFLAVYPANIYMAIEPIAVDGVVPPRWAVWARLPFQALFIWLAWWCTRPAPEKR